MSETIITVQNTVCELVESRIGELELRENLAECYDHDNVMTLKKDIKNAFGS